MGVALSTYYGFTKVREMSPDARDWAVTDGNFELLSRLLKYFEQHTHTGTTAINYPGYNTGNPALPTLATLTELTTGGILTPGTTVGVRLAYLDTVGLETEAAPEKTITIGAAATRPLAPTLTSTQAASPGLTGGTYVYAITKKKGTGETTISDILTVSIPYDTTYSVTLGFSSVDTYTDGTAAINIYRSTGLSSAFQLVTSVTGPTTATFTDTNTIAPGNQNVVPPAVSTFDAVRKVRISWSGLGAHPSGASKLKVYVTQQTGIWGNQSLLQEYDIGTAPTFVDYLGSEALTQGQPSNASQIPASPAKLDLATQTIGAPSLTANMNFNKFQALNMVAHNNSGAPATPVNGQVYYDTSMVPPRVRAFQNGAWVDWGTSAATAYSHPAEEAGGHAAANIRYTAGSATPTLKTALDNLFASGLRKQVTAVSKNVGVTSSPTTTSSTAALIPEMNISGLLPAFNSQYIRASFSGHFKGSAAGMNITVAIEYDTITIEETVRTYTVPFTNASVPFQISYMTQMGTTAQAKQVRVLWWVDTGTATAVGLRRSLTTELVF